jgi:lysozyme family protein
MSNYDSAIDFVIGLEDSHPSGKVTYDADGATRYGLLDRWHPDLVAQGFYSLSNDQALALAKACYRAQYWNRIHGDDILSNKVAAQLLSIGVNDGVVSAIKLAQTAIGIQSDGILGPFSLAAINAADENDFLNSFNSAAKDRYDAIVAAHPEKLRYRQGWYNRVDLISTYQG